jgi:hypothetical protein
MLIKLRSAEDRNFIYVNINHIRYVKLRDCHYGRGSEIHFKDIENFITVLDTPQEIEEKVNKLL